MRRERKTIGLILLFLIQTVWWWVWPAEAEQELAGKVVNLYGQVTIRSGKAADGRPAQINQELFAGDLVQTGPASGAAILCADESQIKVNENTILELKSSAPSPRLRLVESVPAAVGKAVHSLYGVPRGEVWLRNKNEKFRFEMETPAVTAAIRGTEFNLRVAPDGASYLTLLEGSLQLANAQGQLNLQPGEEGMARPGQAPTKRVVVQPTDAIQWSLYYPGIFSYRDIPLSISAPGKASPAAESVRRAEASYDQGNLGEARREAEAALRQDPQNGRALTVLGWVNLQINALQEAQDNLRRISQPNDRALVGLALARYRLRDLTGAYELIHSARQRLPLSSLLLTMDGFFSLLVGKVQEAQTNLEAAVRLGQSEALARALLAQIWLVQNRKDLARTEAAKALAVAPHSPAAQLTMALTNIAHFNLEAARLHLEKALQADPGFVDAYVYLAKIWLGSGYLDRAWKTIDKARRLAPDEGDVLTLAGFIRLAYRDYDRAMTLFTHAINMNPGLGEPHLGMGICHFRYQQPDRGLASMLTATLLEPRVSLYQSAMGKALYQVRAFDKALDVYDYAKTLDKNDPTPYLYKGIALTDLNRPGEAIQEINRSIDLNDNQAIFRSRIMLDQDRAVQNYNLAKSYNKLGLGDWAYSKAVTAVKKDPTNSSAQFFLGNAYYATRQRLGAGTSSLLLYRMLSPANQNTFSQGNDYTPMFEMPYWRVLAEGGIGTWDKRRGRALQNHSLDVYGGVPGLALDVAGFYNDDRGLRTLNSDSQNYSSINFAKWEPTVQDSLFGNFTYLDAERGDDTNLNDYNYLNNPSLRQYSHWRNYEAGYVHRFNPKANLLFYYNYASQNNSSRDYDFGSSSLPYTTNPVNSILGLGYDVFQGNLTYDYNSTTRRRTAREFHNFQLQQQLILGDHTLMGGFDYFAGHSRYRYRNNFNLLQKENVVNNWFWIVPGFGTFDLGSLGSVPINQWLFTETAYNYRPPDRSYSFYLLDYWRLTPNLLVELGVFKDQSKNSRFGFPDPISNSLWSPRLGINYQVNSQHTLRLVLQRHLNTHYLSSPSLVPAEIASFPWQINVDEGALVREAGAAWEAQWNSKTFSVIRFDTHRIDNPVYESFINSQGNIQSDKVYWGWKRYGASASLNHILTPYLGLSMGAVAKKIDPSVDYTKLFIPPSARGSFRDFFETDVGLGLAFLHRTGWQGWVRNTMIHQNLEGRADNFYWLVDLAIGKELDNKRGMVFLGVDNLFNRHFYYQKEFVTFDAFYPVRRISFKLALWF